MAINVVPSIAAAGFATTLAGSVGVDGPADASGAAAPFYSVQAIATDSPRKPACRGYLERYHRQVSLAGGVTTLAAVTRNQRLNDDAGRAARLVQPSGIVVDDLGNAYIADTPNHALRKITPAGIVTTIAGASRSGGITLGLPRARLTTRAAWCW
jgi:hypothetical protein